MTISRFIKLAFLTLLLASCGGGSGGDSNLSSNVPPNTASAPKPTLSVNVQSVAVSATTGSLAPTQTLSITIENPPSVALETAYTVTSAGVASVQIDQVIENTATATISFKSPGALGPGTYTDTLKLSVCYDAQCKTPIAGSPVTIVISYVVTGPPLKSQIVLSSLMPASTPVASTNLPLSVTGTGFTSQDNILVNGQSLATMFVSQGQLTANVPSSYLQSPANLIVTVADGSNGVSNALTLVVRASTASPSISSISPAVVTAGDAAFLMTVTGSAFTSSSVVQFAGSSRQTTFMSSTQLTAQILAADVASPSSFAITVSNPGSPGTVSSAVPLIVALGSVDATNFKVNAAHTNAVVFNNLTFPSSSAWSVTLSGKVQFPLVADGKVFVVAGANYPDLNLYALNATTGAIVWGPISIAGGAIPVYDNHAVFVQTGGIDDAPLMQAFDADTGTLKWTTSLGTPYANTSFSPPTASNGQLFTIVTGIGSTTYSINESDGSIAWSWPNGSFDSLNAAITIGPAAIYLAADCQQIYALNPVDGSIIWSNQGLCSGGTGHTPILANNNLYISDQPPSITQPDVGHYYNPATGAPLGSFTAQPNDYFAIGATRSFYIPSLGSDATAPLYAVSLSNGQALWNFAGDGALSGTPLLVNSYAFVLSQQGNVYAVNANDGSQAWTATVSSGSSAGSQNVYGSGIVAGSGYLLVPFGDSLTAFVLSSAP